MTKEEIINQVKSLNKTHLTNDEVVMVGLMHRELPKEERDWQWMADLINWSGSKESLRQFVLRRVDKVETMETVADNMDKGFDEQRQELFKERQKLRDERTELNRLLRDDARVERLRDSIRDAIKSLDKLPKVSYQGRATNPFKEAIAMVSDLHIGVEIDEYCNKYNLEIASKRMDKLAEDTIKYCKQNNVNRLNICNLGDAISGTIHTTLRIQQEFDAIEQVMQASELLAKYLNRIQEAAPEIIYRSCTDNHSRVVADKHQSIENENFFRLIDWYLQERLHNTKIKFANDNLSDNLGKFYLNNGKLVMFAHGHLENYNKVFQNFVGATEEYVHYALLGHYHSEKLKTFQNLRVYINGSIVGTDQYAESKRLYTKPSQTLLIFDDDNVINYSIGLNIV